MAATTELLDERRDSPGWVYRPAVEEGLVVYDRARPLHGRTRRAIDTFPARDDSPAQAMAKKIRYDEEGARDWLDTVTISKLQDLLEYGGPAQYPRRRGRTTAQRLRDSCDTARALTGHARGRVPEILESRRGEPTRQGPADGG